MKNKLITTALVVFCFLFATNNSFIFAQGVAINEDGSSSHASAMLDVLSSNKGLLIPRVALTGTSDATTISSPETSLLVYNTATVSDVTPRFYYWNGTAWTILGGSATTIGGSGTTNYVARWTPNGSTLGIGLITDDGSKIGINETAPDAKLEINADESSFVADDGSESFGIISFAKNAEDLCGVLGEANLTNWGDNDLLTGVHGKLSWSSTTYAEGILAYENSASDISGKLALIGVAGRVTNGYTNNSKITMAGFFANEYRGTSGNKTSESYGLYSVSDGAGTGSSVNYGIYATASNASTNYAGYFDGDVVIGANGTAITNIIKVTVNKDIASQAQNTYWTETFTVTNATTGSSVIVSPDGVLTDGVFLLYSWVSGDDTVSVRFLNSSVGAWDPAAQDYFITVIK